VISVANLKAWGRMPFFEECAERGQHVLMKDLTQSDQAAFISHRWQDAANNFADDAAASQYQVAMEFLRSEEGLTVTHVWLDLACINQDRGTPEMPNPEGLKQFLLKLDNIGTAIACSHVMLVIPRLVQLQVEQTSIVARFVGKLFQHDQQVEGQPVYYSDLKEYTERGWCLYEIITALSMRRRIILALVCGAPTGARFEIMQPGPAPEEGLMLAKLVEEGNVQWWQNTDDDNLACCSSLRAAVDRMLDALKNSDNTPASDLLDQATECWRNAKDPTALLQKMHQALDQDLQTQRNTVETQQLEAATLTVHLNPRYFHQPKAGQVIAALLPHFTAEGDREVVVRLLINLLVLVRTAFSAVQQRDTEALQALLQQPHPAADDETVGPRGPLGLQLDHKEGPTLNLTKKALLPCEMVPLLDALVAELARREAAGEGLKGRPLRLDFSENPIGPHGMKAVRKAAARLPLLASLDLFMCGMGIAGGLELAELLCEGTMISANLQELELGNNNLDGGVCLALAQALPLCPKLEKLNLSFNNLGEGAKASLSAAWDAPLRDGRPRPGRENYVFGGLVLPEDRVLPLPQTGPGGKGVRKSKGVVRKRKGGVRKSKGVLEGPPGLPRTFDAKAERERVTADVMRRMEERSPGHTPTWPATDTDAGHLISKTRLVRKGKPN